MSSNTAAIDVYKRIKLIWGKSLYRNAAYLIIANGFSAILGFIFWAVAAKYYSEEEIGLASAIIAVLPILAIIANMGLNIGIVRFLSTYGEHPENVLNASYTLSLISSLIISAIFVMGINIWSPDLLFLKQNTIFFILFVILSSGTAMTTMVDHTFIADRHSGLTTLRSLTFNVLKLILLIISAGLFKSYGILNSWGIALLISLFLGLFVFVPHLHRGYYPRPSFKWVGLIELVRFSFVNSIAIFLWNIPGRIIPMFILMTLGAEANAYFYISWIIVDAVSLIPYSVANSLLAEGSKDEHNITLQTPRSLNLIMLLMIPISISILIFGDKLLFVFGSNYSTNASLLLKILTVSLFPASLNQVYFSNLRIQKRLVPLMVIGIFIAIVTIIFAYWLLPQIGILAMGIGWLTCQTAVSVWVITKEGWGKSVFKQQMALIIPSKKLFNNKTRYL